MSRPASAQPLLARRGTLPAAGVILVLWLGYTVLQVMTLSGRVSPDGSAFLALLPGMLGVALLLVSGFSRSDCFLRLAPLSRTGALALAASLLLLIPVLSTAVWSGWNPFAALVAAPASAIAQEVFFRAVLLPFLLARLKGRIWPALLIHSALFGLWHIGAAFMGAPIWAALAVMLVPALAGLLWGWQVQRDRTLVWVLLVHLFVLFLNSFFTWA